jgi:hypothetical protein
MANTILTKTEITRNALRILHNNLAFSRGVDKQYDNRFAKTEKIGNTLQIRLPNRYEVTTGAALNTQDVEEEQVTLTVATQKHVAMNFTTAELTMKIDDFSKRILRPAMAKLASVVDRDGLTEAYQNTYNSVGAYGTTPNTLLVWLQAGQKLDEFATPRDDQRGLYMNPAAMASTVDALKGLFQSSNKISEQYQSGMMGQAAGFKWNMTQNVNVHTQGAFAGTTLVDEAGGVTSGDEVLTVDAFTDSAPTVKKGDIFTVAGVNAVNPETGQDNGVLQQFVVTADTTGSSNEITIPLAPAMINSGAKKTITALPANEAAVTFLGTAEGAKPINIACHKEAITLVTADLQMPKGVDFASRAVFDGISLRLVRQYDINNDRLPCRVDVYYGWKMTRPEMSCRVQG